MLILIHGYKLTCVRTLVNVVFCDLRPRTQIQLAHGRQILTKREIASALVERREIKYYSGEEVEKDGGGRVKKNNGKLRILIAGTTVRYFSLFYLFLLHSPRHCYFSLFEDNSLTCRAGLGP